MTPAQNLVFSRRVNDEWEAVEMSKAILRVGGTVLSITFDGRHRNQGAIADTSRFIVFATAPDSTCVDLADRAFGKWRKSLRPQP